MSLGFSVLSGDDLVTLILSGIAAIICSARVSTLASCSPKYKNRVSTAQSVVIFSHNTNTLRFVLISSGICEENTWLIILNNPSFEIRCFKHEVKTFQTRHTCKSKSSHKKRKHNEQAAAIRSVVEN